MVAWYKHDIPAWMDGTESLSDGEYRVYHVVCQLIYLSEGPIALNEHGIAGRCKQSIRTFRTSLKTLLELGKLTLIDGRLANSRAKKELQNVSENRLNASKGGQKSSEVRNSGNKSLKTNGAAQATLQDGLSLKTREEETREEKKDAAPNGAQVVSFVDPQKVYFDQAHQYLGKGGRSLAGSLLKAKGNNIPAAHQALLAAMQKSNPREYLGAIIRGREDLECRPDRSF